MIVLILTARDDHFRFGARRVASPGSPSYSVASSFFSGDHRSVLLLYILQHFRAFPKVFECTQMPFCHLLEHRTSQPAALGPLLCWTRTLKSLLIPSGGLSSRLAGPCLSALCRVELHEYAIICSPGVTRGILGTQESVR